jgi:hypothetical protein
MRHAFDAWRIVFVQHQFEGVYWAREGECNIGYHHVHHLGSRIPRSDNMAAAPKST